MGRVHHLVQWDRSLDRRRVDFSGLLTMAGWLRHRDSVALSAAFGRSPRAGVLRCGTCPILHLFAGVGKAQEPVGVQTFCAEATIEGFNECIVSRLSGSGEVECDAALVGPQIQIA
jgi:hypothetical protein